MKSHELAELLLSLPDLPVATHAFNHTYMSDSHELSHGKLKIGLIPRKSGDCIVIGDISDKWKMEVINEIR